MLVKEYAEKSNFKPPKTSIIETAYNILLEQFGSEIADTERQVLFI